MYNESDEIAEELNFGIYGNPKAELEEEMKGEMLAMKQCINRSRISKLFKKCECGYHV